MKRWVVGFVACLGLMGAGMPAWAQSRPLVTEDPETVPAGNILFEAGLEFQQDAIFPASGLTGRLWKIGSFGFSFGVSSIAEIQVDGGLRNRLVVTLRDPGAPLAGFLDFEGDSTSDFEDFSIGAKVRFMAETPQRPAMAVRFSTRLPNAGNESGLGLDTTDFNFGLAFAKTVQSVRVVGNVGLGILGDPTRGDKQNDVLTYGVSVARAVATGVEIVGELNGRASTRSGTPPVGTDSRSIMRVGARLTRGPVRADGALLVGVTERDPTWGFTGGVTWVFKGFTVQ
ncbi:MAG TPA: transporter [Vicinamibacterales bacterium]|nr:transporter [Vicinamibacterales bacterium]